MRLFTPLLFLALWAMHPLNAEGTRELAPNGSIDIMGNTTTDVAALHINHPSYNSFGAYDNPNPQSRLYIHITDPGKECIYLGFNWAHNNLTSQNPPRINFEYRIKDPNGNVVFGPVTVTPVGANIQNWSAGWNGPAQIHGAGGYNATLVTSLDLSSSGWTGKGDYYIEFEDQEFNDFLIDFWDITVADCSNATPVEKKGRVWSYNWSIFAINDFNFPNRPFNGAFYVCAPDPDDPERSFVTKIDFNNAGFRPAAFNVAINSFGTQNTGDVTVDRRSIELENVTQPEYAIFLNDPVDLCETAEAGMIEILGISRCNSEEYCIKFTTSKAGLVDLLLDFDGPDNIYTPGTADVMIPFLVTPDLVGIPTCLTWNGLDGLGNPLPEDTASQIPITMAFAQGIYHFPIYDAELMTNGVRIAAIRPSATITNLFYDDSNISVPSGSGEPEVQLSGCTTPCHRWTNYTLPDAAGFGNLNTINSWWFSQLVIRQDVLYLPAYYTCDIDGITHFCEGGSTQLTMSPLVSPLGAAGGEIINTVWEGPGIIGPNTGDSITVGTEGVYSVKLQWLTPLGDTCQTECSIAVTLDPPSTETIDVILVQGETIEINGETYSEGGQYIQELTNSIGCDSILTINITILQTIIHYDLNACESFMSNGSHMDYSEFTPTYPQPLPCATIVAETLTRSNPQMKHSCTPGVNNSVGMCVMTLDGCTYIAGHDLSVVIEVNVVPDPDTAVHLTRFSFYEKAPTTYEWISGGTGPNNYPTLFRVRILKNGTEIFLSDPTPTSTTWQQEVYDFLEDDQFLVKDPTLFRFELLSYCPVGNGATESVWDLDEIDIVASCASLNGFNKDIAGKIVSINGKQMKNVEVKIYDDATFNQSSTTLTDENGHYIFKSLVPEQDYYLRGHKNTGLLNGITTIDLILIQKHLLGSTTFDSPYQYIAADANKSNSISAIDMLELRKLILGKYSELPRNTSWRFGVGSQVLDLANPWIFKETYDIEYLNSDLGDIDFIGVKIGDVNGDVVPDFHSTGTEKSSGSFKLKIPDQSMKPGVPTVIEIKAGQIENLFGLQLELDLEGGQVVEVKSGAMTLTHDNFIITSDKQLKLSWSSAEPLDLRADDILFSLALVSDIETPLQDALQLIQESITAEAYAGENLDQLDIALEFTTSPSAELENILFPVEPNPFTSSTTVRFQLQKAETVTIGVYDLSGRLLTEESGEFSRGLNSIEISREELNSGNGLLLLRVESSGFVATQKILLLKD